MSEPNERPGFRVQPDVGADVTADDRLVWSFGTGTYLRAKQDVRMEDTGERAFTGGRVYRVVSMHPIAVPAYVKLTNDQGEPHEMQGVHLRLWFERTHSPNARIQAAAERSEDGRVESVVGPKP